jgi:ABC-type proline/glycine betaine transport system permease subunit
MEWFIVLAPVPNGAVEFGIGNAPALVALLLAAVTPVALVVRHALGLEPKQPEVPALRVIEGGRELNRRAA